MAERQRNRKLARKDALTIPGVKEWLSSKAGKNYRVSREIGWEIIGPYLYVAWKGTSAPACELPSCPCPLHQPDEDAEMDKRLLLTWPLLAKAVRHDEKSDEWVNVLAALRIAAKAIPPRPRRRAVPKTGTESDQP